MSKLARLPRLNGDTNLYLLKHLVKWRLVVSAAWFTVMGDSDDEYDRRRRDKFRRERSDYDRSREREDRRRDDWNDR